VGLGLVEIRDAGQTFSPTAARSEANASSSHACMSSPLPRIPSANDRADLLQLASRDRAAADDLVDGP
jgi:hypothetical protein